MSKAIDVGVFIPTVSRGWLHSANTPYTPGTFKHALHVTRTAELFGYDFVLSPQNWRGTRGAAKYWRHSLNSLATSGALLQATESIKVWSTAHITALAPAVVADMVATYDQIAPGRTGVNIVTGGHKTHLDTLGLWNDELDHDQRYDMADEWVDIVKALWTRDVFDYNGKHFRLYDAMMDPKPSTMPTLVNAGASGRGYRFAVENCDIAFMVCGDDDKFIESAKQSKRIARELNKPDFKTYAFMTLVPGETDKSAKEYMDWIESRVDLDGLADLEGGYKANTKGYSQLSSSSLATLGGEQYRSVLPGVLIGSYETLAEKIARTVVEGELDGVLVVVPDYLDDLKNIALRTMPRLDAYQVTTSVGVAEMNAGIKIDPSK